MHTFEVESAGARLAVSRVGPPTAPTVLLLHGYPDNREVWRQTTDQLSERFDVVAADMRGAGESTAPADRSGYHMRRLVDDVANIIAELPGPVHLVGHDWGSVQGWGAVLRENTDARLTGRIASFTSISGPPLALVMRFIATELGARRVNRAASQIAHSWYIGAFQLPWIPELVLRTFGDRIRRSLLGQRAGHSWPATFTQDAIHGINLYRANAPREALRPSKRGRTREQPETRGQPEKPGQPKKPGQRSRTRVPVQLIVPLHDAFVLPVLFDRIGDFAESVDRTDIPAGHWVQLSHPSLVAELIEGHVKQYMT